MTTTGIEYLTDEQIDALLGVAKTRGAYKEFMGIFMASEARGVNATQKFPGKAPASIYQGLNTVKKAQNIENIRIINHEDTVFILRTDEVAVVEDSDETEDSE